MHDVDERLIDTRRLADFNSSTLNTLYDPHTKVVTGNGFKVLTSGNNVAGIMAGSADGIEFQTSGGNGYVNITVDDVRIPVNSGGGDEFTTMKRINSDLEDCIAEKDELRREYDKTKETVEKVINIDDQTSRSVYTENLVTKTATVDSQLTVGQLQLKGREFNPKDIDANDVPARFANVYINNTDVLNSIMNLESKTKDIETELSLEGIGVGVNIRRDTDGLAIEGYSLQMDTISSQNYIVLDAEKKIRGRISAGTEKDFGFYASDIDGQDTLAKIKCDAVDIEEGGTIIGEKINNVNWVSIDNNFKVGGNVYFMSEVKGDNDAIFNGNVSIGTGLIIGGNTTSKGGATFEGDIKANGMLTVNAQTTLKGNLNVTSGGMSISGDSTIRGTLSAQAFLVGNQNVIAYIDTKYNELQARIAALERVLQNSNQ